MHFEGYWPDLVFSYVAHFSSLPLVVTHTVLLPLMCSIIPAPPQGQFICSEWQLPVVLSFSPPPPRPNSGLFFYSISPDTAFNPGLLSLAFNSRVTMLLSGATFTLTSS